MAEKPLELSDELRAAIGVAAERITIDPYYTVAMNKGLKGHAMGFWSGTLMGLLTGSAAGMILHATAGAALAASGLAGWPIVLGLAGVGAGMGGVVGSRVGSTAGAVSGVMMEFERRLKARELEAEVMASPEKQAEVLARYRQNPVAEKDDTVGEIFATSASPMAAWGKVILPATMVLTMALCATAGAIIGAGAFMLSGGAGIGLGALQIGSAGAAALAGAGLGAATGITFGIYYPAIFSQLTQVVGQLLSGDMAARLLHGEPAAGVDRPREKAPILPSVVGHPAAPVAAEVAADRPRPHVAAAHAQLEGLTADASRSHTLH